LLPKVAGRRNSVTKELKPVIYHQNDYVLKGGTERMQKSTYVILP